MNKGMNASLHACMNETGSKSTTQCDPS